MGNLCSSPQPVEPKPAPKQGEPVPNPELIQLRNMLDSARATLKALVERKPGIANRLSDLPPKIEANRPITQQVEAEITPIDAEIQSKLMEDSDAEATICGERKAELTALVAVAEKYHEQKSAAESLWNDVSKLIKDVEKLQALLTDLMVKATPYPEELTQVKDLLDRSQQLHKDSTPMETTATAVKSDASGQEDDYAPIRERLYRYAAVEIVEDSGNYVEAVEEQEVAAEIIDEFAGVEEFFDEGTYSGWLYRNSLLLKAYRLYTAENAYPKANIHSIVQTFEKILSEKAASDATDREAGVVPMDFDHFLLITLLNQENGQQVFCEFIGGLLEQVQNGQYPEVIARLLGLHEKRSCAPAFTAALPEIYAHFANEFQYLKLKKQVTSLLMEESTEETLSELLNGGQISLSHAINSLFQTFPDHPSTALAWIRCLKPDIISEENYLLYLLCNRIKSINSDSNKLFKDLTSERTLSYDRFASGLKKKFNLQLTDAEFRLLFDRIDRKHEGAMARVGMTQEIKLTWYYEMSGKPEFTLTKAKFLNAFLEVGREYMKTIAWETYLATKGMRSGSYEYPVADFEAVAQALEVSDSSALVLEKVQELSEQSADGHFGLDELVRYVLRRPVGFLGSLLVRKLHTESPVSAPFANLPDALKILQES